MATQSLRSHSVRMTRNYSLQQARTKQLSCGTSAIGRNHFGSARPLRVINEPSIL
jgi:hypothetical protein